jgi:aromatic ring-opening dioxygenase catalytic subunit (LigB family)
VGEIVWAACVSHAGGQLRVRRSEREQDKIDRVYAGWEGLRASLHAARPDALVVVGTDHLLSFSIDQMPVFALGRGDRFPTWGEFGTRETDVAGHATLADRVHADLVAGGFDVSGCAEMRLDHAYACPLELLDPERRLPVAPLSVTTFAPPLPPLARCRALGEALGRSLRAQDDAARVALLGTGGISHAIGTPDAGRVDPDWDCWFLDRFEQPDLTTLDGLSQEQLEAGGGFGAGEVRSWMVVLGAAGGHGARRLVYEPVEAWITGISLVEVAVA